MPRGGASRRASRPTWHSSSGRSPRCCRLCPRRPRAAFTVPRGYTELLYDAICHRAPDRFALLYEVLWRILHGERDLVSRARCNGGTARRLCPQRAARHPQDARILEIPGTPGRRNILHRMVRAAALHPPPRRPVFVDRFGSMDWIIATPIGTAAPRKDGALTYGLSATTPPTTKRQRARRMTGSTYHRHYVQSGAAAGAGHGEGNAAATSAQHAGDLPASPTRPVPRPSRITAHGRARRLTPAVAVCRADRGARPAGARAWLIWPSTAQLRAEAAACRRCATAPPRDADRVRRRPRYAGVISSANSRATRRTSRAVPSWARPASVRPRPASPALPRRGLRHQCGEAFQDDAARKAAHPQDAERG